MDDSVVVFLNLQATEIVRKVANDEQIKDLQLDLHKVFEW